MSTAPLRNTRQRAAVMGAMVMVVGARLCDALCERIGCLTPHSSRLSPRFELLVARAGALQLSL